MQYKIGVDEFYSKGDFAETESERSQRIKHEKHRIRRLDEIRNAGELTTVKESLGEYNGSLYPITKILGERKWSRHENMTEKSEESKATLLSADDAFDENREIEDPTLKAAAEEVEEDYQYHSYSLG